MEEGTAPRDRAQPLLTVENLAVEFDRVPTPKKAVTDISLTLNRGETLALVGESGSGKSLTALAVMGLLPKGGRVRGGSIRLGEVELTSLPEERMRALRGSTLGMVFQEPMASLNPVYRIGFHLAEALGGRKALGKDELAARSVALLREVGVPEPEMRLSAYPHQLSGGLRQRVMIACAIARNPSVLIADEPTTALDVTVQAQIMQLLDRLKSAHSTAVLLVTHDLGLVARHAARVTVAYAGFSVESARVTDLFERPYHPYTAALLASMPRLGHTGRLKTIPGNVPDADSLPPGCPFSDRCPRAIPACSLAVPPVTEPAPGRSVRCIRALE